MSRRFLQPSKVPQYLKCSICSDVFSDPVLTPCGHTFCKMCIGTWLKQTQSCPICRVPANQKSLSVNRIAKLAVEDLEVICLNKGCAWTGKCVMLGKHDKSCLFHPGKIEPWVANKIPENKFGEEEDLDDGLEKSILGSMYLNHAEVMKEVLRPKETILTGLGLFSSDEEN